MDLTPREKDKLRLTDTALIIEVADDHTLRTGEGLTDAARRAIGYGEEVKFGGGKTIRDGMGQSQARNGWQTAHKMKLQRGALTDSSQSGSQPGSQPGGLLGGDTSRHDNVRVKRYIAKLTINPALSHGIAHEVGSIAVGK